MIARLVRAVWRRGTHRLSVWLGRDFFTGQRVRGRADLKAIGSRHGSWVVPAALLGPQSVCYCVGCGEDITFDLGLIKHFGCHVYGFDPTPRAIAHVKDVAGTNRKYHFVPTGVWDVDTTLKFYAPRQDEHVSHSALNLQKTDEYFEAPVKRLKHIMQSNGHEALDLLKLDVEGAEYRIVDSIIGDDIDIKILCIEYDEFFHPMDADYEKRIRDSVEDLLKAGFELVHAQGYCNYTFVKSSA